eukprot:Gb_05132 [translate_table: standard]
MASRMEGVKGRKILAAVDDSEQSMYALKWAMDNLQLNSSDTLILCHVKRLPATYEGLGGPGLVLTPEVAVSLEKYQERVSQNILKHALNICSGSKVNVETRIIKGDAREAICSAVQKFQVDFLIMGSHGYGAFKRSSSQRGKNISPIAEFPKALLGSVSDYCAHHAKCPVMIVKKPHD